MAPPKASLPARIFAGDFMGINWNRVSWMAPYNNFYPITMCGGWGGRMWSSFIQYGRFDNRAGLIMVRNLIMGIPTALMALLMLGNMDWYQCMQCAFYLPGIAMPQWAQNEYAKEMEWASWNKPGAMAKHHYAGTVSIPGTEKYITEM
ncbi:conserved hypothetical protein [Leishmania infantum JPCM5]|uniref:Uncharacterized protein n=3 Tax=Leishmania donovani species complex TaxID=38574 RepID=A4I8I1_LEIIN|nr:conserved hypothetical protein [Leishmania infantum JPCM5]XP_003863788.1 hypothetical protein, conserved [Leishmania donovani]CAC9528252.1 hypothetical_protein_-_conserved [Leishmania infantum]AYU81928.1 hypothetical protein LdCL_320043700 [Leishmania donovani]TPP43875.1 hypothetical protein CGC21_21370 [Leishmania donovani]CAM71125.1 conserved hypothetical protein [Leishmania infantum JPCM5]CBZ37105.1 hypothetical protein, conserved [Leishmania donovani]|eukprot:XP_001468050.1 conserved hypothetical protein [Leishmania infantum JPCM5]